MLVMLLKILNDVTIYTLLERERERERELGKLVRLSEVVS